MFSFDGIAFSAGWTVGAEGASRAEPGVFDVRLGPTSMDASHSARGIYNRIIGGKLSIEDAGPGFE